jgi:hypothetical protein
MCRFALKLWIAVGLWKVVEAARLRLPQDTPTVGGGATPAFGVQEMPFLEAILGLANNEALSHIRLHLSTR